ncbi:D-alanine--D-alanine ligase [Rubrivirga sp.]|uniref:D-alanine--D-alanine ligase n=1 Tax=Rubrivirga sp. TaxID=1885344 RepID=UPI003B52279E
MTGALRVGLCYDRFGDAPRPPGAPPDWDAEYEPEETVAALEAALRRLGHAPVRIGNARALLAAMGRGPLGVDAAVTIAESYGSRNREAHVPVLLELAGVPCVGSDALSLSVSLDKHLTKIVVDDAGVAVPAGVVVPPGADAAALAAGLAFPLMVKPRYEGTAKGIAPSSRCETPAELRAEVVRQHALYGQDVVVEAFVDGAEFTVGVVGTGGGARALPALQRAVEPASGIGVHALAGDPDAALDGALTPALDQSLADAALAAHRAIECRDFSRSDFRVGPDGAPVFIEINPLPTFAPDGTFAILAELDGQPYDAFLADVLGAALARALGTESATRARTATGAGE